MHESLEPAIVSAPVKLLLFANTEWYLYNFRLALARAARARGAEVVMVSPPGPYGEKLRAEGFRWIDVPMARRSLNPFRELYALYALYRVYCVEKPDIAHHFTTKCVIYGGLVARSVGTRGVVGALTGMGYVFGSEQVLARALRPLVRRMLHFAASGRNSRLIVQNRDDGRAVVESGVSDASQVRLIAGSGVDTRRYRPQRDVSCMRDEAAVVVFAARLLWDKGIGEFVAAARALRAEALDARFIVAGESDPGNPGSVPDDQLTAWREEGAVTLLGHVHDMAELLTRADLVVLPSYYREGVPRTLIEAAAAGLPVVTTDAPGCRDVVEDGISGFLVPKRDSVALAAAIKRIVTDRTLAARMGAAGRRKAVDVFDERIVLAKTLAVYQELVPEWGNVAVSFVPC